MKNNSITIRVATFDDIEPIKHLMDCSMKILGKGHYSEQQIDSCCEFVCVPDQQLIKDKTFFVVLHQGNIIGCGGWSFRNKLCAGPKCSGNEDSKLDPENDRFPIRAMFTDPEYIRKGIGSMILEAAEKEAKMKGYFKGTLAGMISGVAFYKAKGWIPVIEKQIILPNGIPIEVIQMKKNFYKTDVN